VTDILGAVTGVSAIQSDIATCNWGGLAFDGVSSAAMVGGLFVPGVGEAEVAVAGGSAITKVAQVERTYQVYIKTSLGGAAPYVGRTSGFGTPVSNVAARDVSHHMTSQGFDAAQLLFSTPDAAAARGMEQKLIDQYGGARSIGGKSSNATNGISPLNPKYSTYMNAANKALGGF